MPLATRPDGLAFDRRQSHRRPPARHRPCCSAQGAALSGSVRVSAPDRIMETADNALPDDESRAIAAAVREALARRRMSRLALGRPGANQHFDAGEGAGGAATVHARDHDPARGGARHEAARRPRQAPAQPRQKVMRPRRSAPIRTAPCPGWRVNTSRCAPRSASQGPSSPT